MSTNKLDNISENLHNLLLHLHKTVLNPGDIMKTLPMPPSHVRVIFYLKRKGNSSISEAAKNLLISKPNMTPIIDKLICEGMVNRYDDPNDRRILRVELTDKGNEFVKQHEEKMKHSIAQKLSILDSDDLNSLDKNLTEITNILLKLK